MAEKSNRLRKKAKVHCDEVEVATIPAASSSARRHFVQIADQVVNGWMTLKEADNPSESPHSWFKRNMYRLIKAYLDEGRQDLFGEIARRSGRPLVGLQYIEDNPFKLALFGMWSGNESLSRHYQRVFGTQMLYAYRHDVPPEHLIGFIHVAGSPTAIAKKLASGDREPGFPPA